MDRTALAEWIRDGLWFIPFCAIAAAILLSFVTQRIDKAHQSLPGMFHADASSAQDLLATIASSTLTMTTLVLSITIVALQLASQQFSPRVMRAFLRDTGTKAALGFFLATTVYALLILRSVVPKTVDQTAFVPRLGVSVAFTLILGSLATFVYYINHVAHAIRAVSIMEAVAAETRVTIRRTPYGGGLEPGEWPERLPEMIISSDQPPGALVGIDRDDVVRLAQRHDVKMRLTVRIGDYLPSRIPLVEVWGRDGKAPNISTPELLRFIGLGHERTMTQDTAFGLRQLVDMADKAMSPAINDPTTAVQVIDRLHDILRRMAIRPDAATVFRDLNGIPRLVVPAPTWEDHLHLAFDEVRLCSGGSVPVQRRLRAVIADLEPLVADDPARSGALGSQLRLLDRAAANAFRERDDLVFATSDRDRHDSNIPTWHDPPDQDSADPLDGVDPTGRRDSGDPTQLT